METYPKHPLLQVIGMFNTNLFGIKIYVSPQNNIATQKRQTCLSPIILLWHVDWLFKLNIASVQVQKPMFVNEDIGMCSLSLYHQRMHCNELETFIPPLISREIQSTITNILYVETNSIMKIQGRNICVSTKHEKIQQLQSLSSRVGATSEMMFPFFQIWMMGQMRKLNERKQNIFCIQD